MITHIDVDRYLQRIGFSGPADATLASLQEIAKAHTSSIAFENLTPLSGKAVSLDLGALEEKLVAQRRGGYCFEQNLLLQNVLQQIGFPVTGLAARVMWNAPASIAMPRTHMLLRVEAEGEPHIVDVGFGGLTLTGALRLRSDIEQSTPHEPFRLREAQGELIMQARVRAQWQPLYRFDLQPQMPVDYEAVNWYLSTYPESRFVKNLIAARPAAEGRHALFNNELATHYLNGETMKRKLTSAQELRDVLAETFLIDVPEGLEADGALRRVTGDG